ncbi:MAG: helix-turn-helix transcriptional regulator [Bacteroidota bacterium]
MASETNIKTPNFGKAIPFKLFDIADIISFYSSMKIDPSIPHRTNFYILLFLTEGETVHEVDFKPYRVGKGDCLFISKEQIHKFDTSSKREGYIFIFSEEFILRHFSLSAISKINFLYNYHLTLPLFKDFKDQEIFIIAVKRELLLESGKTKFDIIASILTVFLLKAQFNIGNESKLSAGDYNQFIAFQKIVVSKHMETRVAKHYASILNMTLKQLNNLCKIFINISAKEYISNYIILESKRRLATNSNPVKEIAHEVGFTEATNFLKFFKRKTGMTPGKFRALQA